MEPNSDRRGSGGTRTSRRSRVAAAAASALVAVALCGCGAIRPGLAPVTARPSARHSALSRGSWLIAPDAPLPPDSRWWPVLAVSRRFAAADMSYEVGELGPAVRRSLARTCTARFAAELLGHRASLPPGVRPRQVRQHLVAVQPLERLPDAAVVLATVEPNRRSGQPGAFELRLVVRGGGWRVAAMSIV